MTPQELKNSILQLAIQGKLVEQRPEEGTAEELIETALLKTEVDGHRVKQKEITEIQEADRAFDIPESWEWIKLGNICTIARGGSPRPIKDYITTAEDGINWIKIGDTEKNGKYITSTAEKIKPSGAKKSRMVHVGDFLLTNSMSFGRPYILKVDGCIHDGWLVISQSIEIFDQDYLYWLLSSAYAYEQFCGKVSGAVVKNLNSEKVANSVFPLPPLAEQKRIVAKIEEFLPYIDRYEQAWSRLEAFNQRFPDDMRKSILQLAIQGKLVEQRPEEGTAEELYQEIQAEKQRLIKEGKIKKEKPLPEIAEEEKPFEIPESWKWVRLIELCRSITDGDHQPPPQVSRGIPFLVISNVSSGYIDFSDTRYVPQEYFDMLSPDRIAERGDILFTVTGSYGIPIKVNCSQQFCFQRHIALLKLLVTWDYLFYALKSPVIQAQCDSVATGTAQKTVGLKSLRSMLIPLPPLAEQKRIVARLEEVLAVCERLK